MKPILSPGFQANMLAEAEAAIRAQFPKKPVTATFWPSSAQGKAAVRVTFEWPGIVRIFDSVTNELLAESQPGSPLTPKA